MKKEIENEALDDLASMLKRWVESQPDVRSVALVIDWAGDANYDPNNAASIWLDRHGNPPAGDLLATNGILKQTLKLLNHLASEAQVAGEVIRKDLMAWEELQRQMLNQTHDRRDTYEKTKAKASELQGRLEELERAIRRRTDELDALRGPRSSVRSDAAKEGQEGQVEKDQEGQEDQADRGN